MSRTDRMDRMDRMGRADRADRMDRAFSNQNPVPQAIHPDHSAMMEQQINKRTGLFIVH
jgi:hypothetical protein